MKRAGKRMAQWERIRKELKIKFMRAGITSCEIQYPQCWGDITLGFAHLKKRRNCTEEDLHKVVLACGPCHTAVEGRKDMGRFLQKIIDKREVQPT